MLIKIGGAPLENPELVKKLCNDLSLLRASGVALVLVHGGGKAINKALEQKGITWDFSNGQRVTSKEMMSVVEEVLCGQVNKNLVRLLNAHGVKAVGLSGADGQLMTCSRLDENLGEVGKIENVNAEVIADFLEGQKTSNQGYTGHIKCWCNTERGDSERECRLCVYGISKSTRYLEGHLFDRRGRNTELGRSVDFGN